jgi:hypothetical protein
VEFLRRELREAIGFRVKKGRLGVSKLAKPDPAFKQISKA